MSDLPTEPVEPHGEPDPAVTAALRSVAPPPHRDTFWTEVDGRIAAQAPTGTVRPTPPRQPPLAPPLTEVTPIAAAPRRRFPGWLVVAAAALVVVAALGTALLARTTSTDVQTTSAASTLPAVTTTLLSTTLPPPPTRPTAPVTAPVTTPKPTAAPTTVAPSTTTRPPLVATPEGIGPLRIGMTIKQTAATGVLGPYDDPLETGGQCGYAEPTGPYTSSDFSALFLDGRLARLYIAEGSRIRTPEGIGSGSASSKLKAVAGTRTESPHPYQRGTNVDIMRGDVGYQFTVDGGKVLEWSVGTREGLSLPEGCA